MSILLTTYKHSELYNLFQDLFVRERKALREAVTANNERKRLERKFKRLQLRKRVYNITGLSRIEKVKTQLDVKLLSAGFELYAQTLIHQSCKETMIALIHERACLERHI